MFLKVCCKPCSCFLQIQRRLKCLKITVTTVQ